MAIPLRIRLPLHIATVFYAVTFPSEIYKKSVYYNLYLTIDDSDLKAVSQKMLLL